MCTVLIAIQLFHRKHKIKESQLLFTQFMLPNEFYCKISLSNGISAITNSNRFLFSVYPSLISTWNSNMFAIFQSAYITDITSQHTKYLPMFEIEEGENLIQGMQYIKAICRNCKNQFNTIFDLNSLEDISFLSGLAKKSLEETSLNILNMCVNTMKLILTKKQDRKMQKADQNVIMSNEKISNCSLFISFCSSCTCFCIIPLQTGTTSPAKNQFSCRTIIDKIVSILPVEVLRYSELQSYAECCSPDQINYLADIENHLTKFKLKREEKECKPETRDIFTFRDISQVDSSDNCYRYHKTSLSASHENQINSNLQEHRYKMSDMQSFGMIQSKRFHLDPNLVNEKFAIRLQQNDDTKNSYYRLKSGRKLISDRSNQNYCASFVQKQATRKGLTLRCSFQNQTIMQVNSSKRCYQHSEQNQTIQNKEKANKIQEEKNKRQRNNSKRLDTQQNTRSTSTKRRRSSQLFGSSKTKKQNIRLLRKQQKKVDPLIQKLKLMKNAFEYACIRNQKKNFIEKTNRLQIHRQSQEKRTLQQLVIYNNLAQPDCQNPIIENNCKNQQQNKDMPEGDVQEQQIEKPVFENLKVDKQFLIRGDCPLKSEINVKEEERNNRCEPSEKNKPLLIDWVWESIQLKLAETIDPIAQNTNFLLETCKKTGINALKQLYLIYKKFFYMRTSLISSLQDPSQPIFAEIKLSNWQQLIANSQFKQRVNKLQLENEQILKTLQKMLKKIEDKRKIQKEFSLSHNNGVWQIVIPDQHTYGLFLKEMFKVNIQIIWKLISLTQEKPSKIQANVPLKYFNCLILAIQDELEEPNLVKNLLLQNKSKISLLVNNVGKLEAIVQTNLLSK